MEFCPSKALFFTSTLEVYVIWNYVDLDRCQTGTMSLWNNVDRDRSIREMNIIPKVDPQEAKISVIVAYSSLSLYLNARVVQRSTLSPNTRTLGFISDKLN